MKKQELLKVIDEELIDKLYGFSYARTSDSFEAQDLCSDIVFALVKAGNTEGEIGDVYPFVWRVARNVYADFCEKRKKETDEKYQDDPEKVLEFMPSEDETENDADEVLKAVYKRIAFLTKAYREVMISFYIDGKSTAEIAKIQGTSETAVRQRLFSARKKVKSEVEEMTEIKNKPVALSDVEYAWWGTGDPDWADPRNVCTRKFSKHIIWLCRKKPMSAAEVAEELGVPTVYVEEEMSILEKGNTGKYGLLRKLDNGKYAINFVLLEADVMAAAAAIYMEQMPKIAETVSDFIDKNKEEYLAFPYLNKKVDLNLIIWQQVRDIAAAFSYNVLKALKGKHFEGINKPDRPFTVFAYVDIGKAYGGCGCDGAAAYDLCGYSKVFVQNIYFNKIKKHFHCGANFSVDPLMQIAIRSIDGLDINTLSEGEKEQAAKAIECGYIYREGNMLYTKILVCNGKDNENLYDISLRLRKGYFEKEAEAVAEKLAKLFKDALPDHLINEWHFANSLASMPVFNAVVDALIDKGIITPPEDGIGAEGCWMALEK